MSGRARHRSRRPAADPDPDPAPPARFTPSSVPRRASRATNPRSWANLALNQAKALGKALLQPDRFWLLLFLPSFVRYMMLLRNSLRPQQMLVGTVVAADPAGLAAVVPTDATIEVVTDGLAGMLQAPAWRHDPALGRGYLLFSQVERNRLWKWEEGGGAFTIGRSLFLNYAGCTGGLAPAPCDGLAVPGVAAVGLVPQAKKDDAAQLLLLSEVGNNRLTRMEGNGTRTPVAVGAVASALAFTAEGDLWFAAPPTHSVLAAAAGAERSGQEVEEPNHKAEEDGTTAVAAAEEEGEEGESQQEHYQGHPHHQQDVGGGGLWRVPAAAQAVASQADQPTWPRAERLAGGLGAPHAMAFSHDRKRLLVKDGEMIKAFDLDADGGVAGPAVPFADLSELPRAELADAGAAAPIGAGGLEVDEKGHVFSAGQHGVAILNPQGRLLGTVSTGAAASGVAFGDDGFLYVTGRGNVCRVAVKTRPPPKLLLPAEA